MKNLKAAIIIPFRDSFNNGERYEELNALKDRIKDICTKYSQPYQIYVIHQKDNYLFNKSSLMNVGASISFNDCDYLIFNDVDHLPIDTGNVYGYKENSCCLVRKHDEIEYNDDSNYWGGVIQIKKEDYNLINGFSNYFWGWGWEDSAVRERLSFNNIKINRSDCFFEKMPHETRHRYMGNPNFINNAFIYHFVNLKLNDGNSNLKFNILNIDSLRNDIKIYDVQIQDPQYNINKILTREDLLHMVNEYNELQYDKIIKTYIK